MTHICTLIAAPETDALDEALVARAAAALPDAGAHQWLSQGEACDIPFSAGADDEPRAFEDAARATLRGHPVDVAARPSGNRRKRLLIADMDSTIIGQECIDEIADFAGLKPKIAAITERAMRGELEFESALRERVALLKGLDESVLRRVIEERIELTPGARTLVMTMRAHGAYCVLVSGGFTFFTGRIAAMAGFDTNQANELEIAAGKLTGRVHEPILGKDAKLAALRWHARERDLALGETLAVGDGANDLAMIAAAGLGVAFHAKPVVAAQAHVRIDHGDLTALLYLQGYGRDAFTR
jgi:phosphoserine phosphatase